MTSSGKNPYAKKPETPENADKPEQAANSVPAAKKSEDSDAPLIAVPMGAPEEKPGDKKKQAAPAAWPGLEQAAAEGKTAVEKAPRIPTPEEKAAAEKAAAQKPAAAQGEVKPAKANSGAKPGQDPNAPALVQVPHSSTEPDEGWMAEAVERNPLAGWALGLGIASVVSLLFVLVVVPSLLVSLAGIIVGVLAVRKAKKNTTEGRRMGMSVAGLVMSSVALTITLVFSVVAIFLFQKYSPDIVACSEQYPQGSDELDQCVMEVINGAVGGN